MQRRPKEPRLATAASDAELADALQHVLQAAESSWPAQGAGGTSESFIEALQRGHRALSRSPSRKAARGGAESELSWQAEGTLAMMEEEELEDARSAGAPRTGTQQPLCSPRRGPTLSADMECTKRALELLSQIERTAEMQRVKAAPSLAAKAEDDASHTLLHDTTPHHVTPHNTTPRGDQWVWTGLGGTGISGKCIALPSIVFIILKFKRSAHSAGAS